MPVDFQQVSEQIRAMGKEAPRRQERLRELRELAFQLLRENARQNEALRGLVERAAALTPHLRCAAPSAEPMDGAFTPAAPPGAYVALAADGSQINPDRHSPVEFGAVNVGAVRMRPGEAPRESVLSQLLFFDELYAGNAPITEDLLALRRDLRERQMLCELARADRQAGLGVAALTDGPLELFREPRESAEYQESFQRYLAVLGDLAGLGVAAAGYVDKPRSDYVVSLLGLTLLAGENHLAEAGRTRPLWPVRDESLFKRLLGPGQRSAVFALRSISAQKFTGPLSLHFFYLNVGRADNSHLARVEIPRWVAEDPSLLDLLHGALLAQSAQMGARPYPYILHRAHEVAVVRFEEKDQLEALIIAELRRQGAEVGEQSYKQAIKDLPGRARLQR